MQATMNQVFSHTFSPGTAEKESVRHAINTLLDSRDASFREILNRLDRVNTRNTLFTIAAMGVADNLTSSHVMRYYHLDSASSVQESLLSLQDEKSPLIKKHAKGVYVIDDRHFELWIAREGHYLDIKFNSAEARYRKQYEIEHPGFYPVAPQKPFSAPVITNSRICARDGQKGRTVNTNGRICARKKTTDGLPSKCA